MGLSASQARFLQLTARKSNVEYEAQQISFERLQIANKTAEASTNYQNKMSNMKMIFTYNDGTGNQSVDVTYSNYKNFINQQMAGLNSSQDRMFLVSTSGKIVVSSEQERMDMITRYSDGNGNSEFEIDDFVIAEDLDDEDNFQSAIKNGIYFFAKYEKNTDTDKYELKSQPWDSIGTGAFSEVYDKTDDAQAEAEYKAAQDKFQLIDKKLELRLNQLETERDAIQTEIDSVQKVIDDNIESSFKAFS